MIKLVIDNYITKNNSNIDFTTTTTNDDDNNGIIIPKIIDS